MGVANAQKVFGAFIGRAFEDDLIYGLVLLFDVFIPLCRLSRRARV